MNRVRASRAVSESGRVAGQGRIGRQTRSARPARRDPSPPPQVELEFLSSPPPRPRHHILFPAQPVKGRLTLQFYLAGASVCSGLGSPCTTGSYGAAGERGSAQSGSARACERQYGHKLVDLKSLRKPEASCHHAAQARLGKSMWSYLIIVRHVDTVQIICRPSCCLTLNKQEMLFRNCK